MGPRPDDALVNGFSPPTEESHPHRRSDRAEDESDTDGDLSGPFEWDRFRQTPQADWQTPAAMVGDISKWWVTMFTTGLIFAGLIGCILITKTTLLVAASNIGPGGDMVCTPTNGKGLHPNCIAVPKRFLVADQNAMKLRCLGNDDADIYTRSDDVALSCAHRTRWTLCVLLMMVVPQLITIFLHTFRCIRNTLTIPKYKTVLCVLAIDSMRVMSVTVLLFYVLPRTQSTAVGVCLLGSVLAASSLQDFLHTSISSAAHNSLAANLLDFLICLLHIVCPGVWILHHGPSVGKSNLICISVLCMFTLSLSFWLRPGDAYRCGKILRRGTKLWMKGQQESTRATAESCLGMIREIWKTILTLLLSALSLGETCTTQTMAIDSSIHWGWILFAALNLSSGFAFIILCRILDRLHAGREIVVTSLLFSIPITYRLLSVATKAWNADPCVFSDVIPMHIHWKADTAHTDSSDMWLFIAWWLCLCWTARHAYGNESQKNLTNIISWIGVLPDVLLARMNRRTRERSEMTGRQYKQREGHELDRKNEIPRIYACVTMWHESSGEMITILKSLLRMDVDQSPLNQSAEKSRNNLYNFEGHIFVDDAVEKDETGVFESRVNSYVTQLVECSRTAARCVYAQDTHWPSPTRLATPYGCRLAWQLPGGNRLVAHIKDRQKIRHRKRWSQVMYMYYFLGHLMHREGNANDTYLLALDGDVNFQPEAVHLLLENMQRDRNVAAVCGRVHPVGKGPLVWYQKFEYAASHWIAKSTEHILGSVLCSPGCFSLLRGSALMADDVMRTYANLPSKPLHFLQYDQGEDRWLCTLLMQQGYRVEYNSESRADTCAPENLDEFFNQRRRWNPAAIVNNLDMLLSWNAQTKTSVNLVYMIYVSLQLLVSLFAPGIVFVICIRALPMALNDVITEDQSLAINSILTFGYLFASCIFTPKMQVRVAALLSVYYVSIQLLILVALVCHMVYHQLCTPEVIFFLTSTGIVCLSALCHPKELSSVVHCAIYFLCIPVSFMLIPIYSVANMNMVSWGTREVTSTEQKEKQGKVFRHLKFSTTAKDILDLFFGPAVLSWVMPSGLRFPMAGKPQPCESTRVERACSVTQYSTTCPTLEIDMDGAFYKGRHHVQKHQTNHILHPCMDTSSLGCGPVISLDQSEDTFFRQLIHRYLVPISSDICHQQNWEAQLKKLRNQVCAFALIANAVAVYSFYVRPHDWGHVTSRNLCGKQTEMDILSLVSMATFGLVILLQAVCMVIHRGQALYRGLQRTS